VQAKEILLVRHPWDYISIKTKIKIIDEKLWNIITNTFIERRKLSKHGNVNCYAECKSIFGAKE